MTTFLTLGLLTESKVTSDPDPDPYQSQDPDPSSRIRIRIKMIRIRNTAKKFASR